MKITSQHLWGNDLVWVAEEGAPGNEETILDHMSLTEPAVWAYIEAVDGGWQWVVMDEWDTFEAEVLDSGTAPTKEAAKRAVTEWVHDRIAGV